MSDAANTERDLTGIRCAVCDDEAMARRRMVRLLTALGSPPVVVAQDADELLEALATTPVDVAFLDIHMPGLSGVDAAQLLPDGCALIFVTAHPEHAVRAFELAALDYVVKPVDPSALRRALSRVPERLVINSKLPIKTRRGVVLVSIADITHALFDGEIVSVCTETATYLTDYALSELEARLPTPPFVRVSRRALLNLDHVELLDPTASGGYEARTVGGALVGVSRQAARKLRRELDV